MDWGIVAVVVGIGVVGWLFWRYSITHMRREVFRHTQARWKGNSYNVKPMSNSGWYIVGLMLLVVVLILLVAG